MKASPPLLVTAPPAAAHTTVKFPVTVTGALAADEGPSRDDIVRPALAGDDNGVIDSELGGFSGDGSPSRSVAFRTIVRHWLSPFAYRPPRA